MGEGDYDSELGSLDVGRFGQLQQRLCQRILLGFRVSGFGAWGVGFLF